MHTHEMFNDDMDSDQIEGSRSQQRKAAPQKSRRTTSYSKRRGQPVAYNGIHRRRKRRAQW